MSLFNTYWPFFGRGMDSFGVKGKPLVEELGHPNEGEVLARVDACAICASDAKMVRMGNDYPLFHNRDFKTCPARLGHELCLTVVESGEKRATAWPPGRRLGVQPDVYLKGARHCIGVNAVGGMAEYIVLGDEVFESDNGSCAFAVSEKLSMAAVAQTEPLACVEASFTRHARSALTNSDRALVFVSPDARGIWDLSALSCAKSVELVDPADEVELGLGGACAIRRVEPCEAGYDVVVVVGNPPAPRMRELVGLVCARGIMAWLPANAPGRDVEVDIAKAHYEDTAFVGSSDGRLKSALDPRRRRDDYLLGGTLLIAGGGGAMGRYHVMRALQHEYGPARIVVTDQSDERLMSLRAAFGHMARQKGAKLLTVSLSKGDAAAAIARGLEGEQASDVVVCAPGGEAVESVVDFLSNDGRLLLFAGTSYGSFARIPLGLVPAYGATIVGHSGSCVTDQLRVVKRINEGALDPNTNVAAVAGLMAGAEALKAVADGRFTGKVIVYPQLRDLPLMGIGDVGALSKGLASCVAAGGWSRKAEELLAEAYERRWDGPGAGGLR